MARARRGERWLIDLGLVQKTRPCLVLSIEFLDHERAVVTYIPRTTHLRQTRFEVPHRAAIVLAQHPDLAIASPQPGALRKLARTQRPCGDKRVTNCGHAADPRRFDQPPENLRKDVRVLVGIEMADVYTCRLNLLNLRHDLA